MCAFYWGVCRPKDINSNSHIRGAEKRLLKLYSREQTKKVVKEINKLLDKIEFQKEFIKQRNLCNDNQ